MLHRNVLRAFAGLGEHASVTYPGQGTRHCVEDDRKSASWFESESDGRVAAIEVAPLNTVGLSYTHESIKSAVEHFLRIRREFQYRGLDIWVRIEWSHRQGRYTLLHVSALSVLGNPHRFEIQESWYGGPEPEFVATNPPIEILWDWLIDHWPAFRARVESAE